MILTFLLKLGAMLGLEAMDKRSYRPNPYNTTEDFCARMRQPFFDVEQYKRVHNYVYGHKTEEKKEEK